MSHFTAGLTALLETEIIEAKALGPAAELITKKSGYGLWKDKGKWVITDGRKKISMEPFSRRDDALAAWEKLDESVDEESLDVNLDENAAYKVNDKYQDGYDFSDAVREVARSSGLSPKAVAQKFEKEFGSLEDGYSLSDFSSKKVK
jgi:hypothetical protein